MRPQLREIGMIVADVVRAGSDVVSPITCAGCGQHGMNWCSTCLAALSDDPMELAPRVEVGVPVWAMGRYRGPYRSIIVAIKEHGRDDLYGPLVASLARGLGDLARWSEIPPARRLVLIPAPTRVTATISRGGDPVLRLAHRVADRLGPQVIAMPVLRTSMWARDSAGLSARGRADNLLDAIHPRLRHRRPMPGDAVVVIDDVLTTGTTAAQTVGVLAALGIRVDAVLVLAGA